MEPSAAMVLVVPEFQPTSPPRWGRSVVAPVALTVAMEAAKTPRRGSVQGVVACAVQDQRGGGMRGSIVIILLLLLLLICVCGDDDDDDV